MRKLCLPAIAAAVCLGASAASAAELEIARGKYLVTIAGCNDCHTPGSFLGKPDFSRTLVFTIVPGEVYSRLPGPP